MSAVDEKAASDRNAATPRSDKHYWALLRSELQPGACSLSEICDDTFNVPEDSPVQYQEERGWLSLLSHLVHGADITRLKVPVSMSAPVSSLELVDSFMRSGGSLCHVRETFDRGADAIERMEAVLKWFFSTLWVDEQWPMEGYLGKRPHMPIIGEHNVQFYDTKAGGIAYVMAEQLSYNPKLTGCYMEAPQMGIRLNSVAQPVVTLNGNSVRMGLCGTRHLSVSLPAGDGGEREEGDHSSESYLVDSSPSFVIRNIFLGKFFVEFTGRLTLRCKESGLIAHVDFHPAGFMGIAGMPRYHVSGEILTRKMECIKKIGGNWTDKVYVWSDLMEQVVGNTGRSSRDKEKEKEKDLCQLFDYSECHKKFKTDKIPCSERVQVRLQYDGLNSNNIWSKVNECIKRNDFKAATHYKAKLTHTQRKYHQMRQTTLKPHKPMFFKESSERFPTDGDTIADGSEELGYWAPDREAIRQFVTPLPKKLAMLPKGEPEQLQDKEVEPPSPVMCSPMGTMETIYL